MHLNIVRLTILILFSIVLNFNLYSQDEDPNEILYYLHDFIIEDADYVLKTLDSLEKVEKSPANQHDEDLFYSLKGQANLTLSNYTEVYNNYTKSLEIARANKPVNKLVEAELLILMGDLFIDFMDYENAKKYYSQAKSIYIEENDIEGELETELSEVVILDNQGKFEQCLSVMKPLENKFKESKNPAHLLHYYHNMTCYHLNLINKEKADSYYTKFLDYSNDQLIIENSKPVDTNFRYYFEVNIEAFQGSIDFSKSQYFLNTDEYDSSLFYLSKANNSSFLSDAFNKKARLELLMEISIKKGDLKTYNLLKDSMAIAQASIHKMGLDNNIKLKDEVEKIQKQMESEKKSSFNRNLGFGIAGLGTLFLAFIFLRKYLGKKANSKVDDLNTKLQKQSKALVKLNEKEKVISELKSELKSISSIESVEEQKSRIKETYKKINLKSNEEILNSKFEQIYLIKPSFFDSLETKFPKLNESEKTILYYIHLDFKNSEIASLLNSSTRSIESKKYRIRKKLDLVNTEISLKEKIYQITE